MGLPRWIPTSIWLVAAAFALGVSGTALSLISSGKKEALQQGSKQTERALASAEAALNRTLLSVDLMLAGVEAPSQQTEKLTPPRLRYYSSAWSNVICWCETLLC